jgi:hypothetical protein
MRDSNVITFMSFVQSDGFNPLTVNGDSFQAKTDRPSLLYETASQILSLAHHVATPTDTEPPSPELVIHKIVSLLSAPWRPGQLLNDLKKLKLQFPETARPTVLILAVRISSPVSQPHLMTLIN